MDVAVIVGQLIGPVLLAGQDRAHLYRLLHQLLAATDVDEELFGQFSALVNIEMLQEITDLVEAIDDPEDPREPGDIVGALIPLAGEAIETIRGLGTASLPGVDVGELAQLLPGYLLGRFLTDQHPVLGAGLGLLATLRTVELADEETYELIELDEVGQLLGDPPGHVAASYGWGGDFDYPGLLDRLEKLAVATRCPVTRRAGDEGHDELVVVLVDAGSRLALTISPALDGSAPTGVAVTVGLLGPLTSAALGTDWSISAGDDMDGASVQIRPGAVDITGPAPSLTLTGQPESPWSVLSVLGTSLQISNAAITLSAAGDDAKVVADSTAKIIFGGTEFDSFLSKMIGGQGFDVDADTTIAWSLRDGFSFGGSATFETVIVIERGIGPIWIHRLTVTAGTGEAGTLELLLTVAMSATVGPLQAAVDGLGLRAMLVPAADGTGTFGPYDLVIGFKPPNGVGFALDAGAVSGGGYLYMDPPSGEYAGVLDFQALGIGICAIGLIDTKVPDLDGWSLFFALYLSIPAIQLGFGFTLTGLGGLAGINRTLDDEALGAAVRAGALDSILFPENPVAEAISIIDQLKSMFPPSPDRYVFGPVVRIGWGTPSLIEAEVGLIISLPDPIVLALLGSVSSVLPSKDLDLVAMHLDVAGTIDFGAGTLTIDTSLHDSHVIGFALSGDMSLRATFIGRPDFLMAVGGVHPGFDEPAGFPVMRRLSLAISASSVIAIHFDCYFALASNAVQFGSSFSLSAKIAGFGIEGGSHFDALVYFSPFEVHTSIGCYIAITAAGLDLAGVWLDASLEGPNPWYVVGTAQFKFLGFKETVRVDERIGSHRAEAAPASEDLLDDLIAALSAAEAWAVVPSSTAPGVLFAPAGVSSGDQLLAMPDGVMNVSQKAAPLNITLDKVGDAPAAPYQHFTLEPAAGTEQSGTVQDWFAPGRFFTLTSTEQLSCPSFEMLDAGIEVGGGDPIAGQARTGTLDFEQILRDPQLAEDRVELPAGFTKAEGIWPQTYASDYAVAVEANPVQLMASTFAVTDRLTGSVLKTTASWSAAHQSKAGKSAATAVVPAWEVPA